MVHRRPGPPTGILSRVVLAISRASARRPRIVVVLWIGVILACTAGGVLTGTKT